MEWLEAMADWLVCNWRRVLSWFRDDIFRQLLQNAGWLLGGTVIAAALGLGSTVIKARTLGPELFGVLAVIVAYVAIVERVATFQPWVALIKYGAVALEQNQPDQFMGLVKMAVFLDVIGVVSGTVIAVVGVFLLVDWRIWEPHMGPVTLVFSISILFNLSGTPTGVLRLLDRFQVFTLQKVLTAGLGLIGAFIVCIAGSGVWGFLIVMLVSKIVGDLFLLGAGLVSLKQRDMLKHWRTPAAAWRPFLQFSGWTYATSTFDIPVKQLDIMIVSAITSFEMAGIYKIIKQSSALLIGMADPLYQAVYPQFAAMVARSHDKKAAAYAVKIGAVIAAGVGPAALLLSVTSPWWLGKIFGEAFAAGWLPLSIFLFLTVLSTSFTAVHPLFTAMGYVKENAIVLFIANAVYLPCAWLFTDTRGLTGLAAAFGIQQTLVIGLKIAYMRRGWAGGTSRGVLVGEARS
jgi:O-antigen/teichoic acid export membrane protein